MRPSETKQRPSYAAIYYFVSRYKVMYAAIVVVTLVVAVFEGFSVAAFFPLFSTMLGNSPESTGGIAGVAQKVVQVFPVSSELVAGALLLISVFLLKIVGILIRDLLVAYVNAKILYSVTQQVMDRYAGAEYEYMVDSRQGDLLYNVLSAPGSVGSLQITISAMIASLMKVVSITVVLIFFLPYPALAFIGLGVTYYLGVHYMSKKITYYLGLGRVAAVSNQIVIANEFLNGFRQIISYNTAKSWAARFERENRTHSELAAKEKAWEAVPRPFLELGGLGLLLGLVLFLNATSTGDFANDLAAMGVFAVAMVQIQPSLNVFGGARIQIMSRLPNVQIAHQILTYSVPSRRDGHLTLTSLNNAIAFENVSFSYKDRNALMDNVDLTFEKGTVTALVGPSGSGKTTLINLILGLYEPTGGEITVDGIPLQDLTRDSWLGRIGFVSQDPFVFNTSIEENIRFNRSGHTKEDVIRAATIANANDFISEFPQGYDTLVGDHGVKLSGGQQQRICIARAVLDSPEILIFDEATSSLDSLSEQLVQEAIDNASTDRTVIIIAHRLSTIRRADKIIVLDNGKIIEQGTHQELLTNQGHYSRQVAASA